MPLKDVEFTDEEITETVEPVMEVVDAIADAVIATIQTAQGSLTNKGLRKSYRVLADKVLRFAKED